MPDQVRQLSLFGAPTALPLSKEAAPEGPPPAPEARQQASLFGGSVSPVPTGSVPATLDGLAAPAAPPGTGTATAGVSLSGPERERALARLAQEAAGCQRCPLRAGCRQVVFGEGNPHATLMLVGEGPGAQEDLEGRPFVGRAGQLLDRMLEAIGIGRSEVYIANVVKCRPPGNRVPTPAEQDACFPWLREQMELIRPEFILCLGATAARRLIDPRFSVTRDHGVWYPRDAGRVMATFHPAALLRDPGKKRLAWDDLKKLEAAYFGRTA